MGGVCIFLKIDRAFRVRLSKTTRRDRCRVCAKFESSRRFRGSNMNHKKKPRRCRCLALYPSLDSPIPRFSNSLGCNGTTKGRPSANTANSYLEFPACKSQKFGHWANIRPLLEKVKNLTICIGNSAPLRTFLLKTSEKKKNLTTDFSGNNTIYWPLLSYLAENQPGVHQFYMKQFEREKCIAENVLVDIVTRSWESLSG